MSEPALFPCPDPDCTHEPFKSLKSLKGHMLKVHKMAYRRDVEALERPSGGVGTLTNTFKEEGAETAAAVRLAKWKNQLKKADPEEYDRLYPEKGRVEKSPTSMLLELEVVKTLQDMRNRNNGGSGVTIKDAATERLEQKVEALQKQIADQKYTSLENSIKELKQEIRSNSGQATSDLAVVVGAAQKTAEKFMQNVSLVDVGMSLAGFNKVPVGAGGMPEAKKALPEARKGIISVLRERGLVTTIRQN